jgi:ribonucleoside-diphosphate reductase alpha chain
MAQARIVKPAAKNQLHDLGYKIFLDRYAQKDMTRKTLAVGDRVIVVVDSKTGQREVGTVTAMALPKVTVQLLDGEIVERDVEHIDKPLETDPGQMMDRVAAGIAAVEKNAKLRKLWTERFRWLLDDFKFVPAGRILTAAGTNQLLTFYNCYVIPSPRDSRYGIIETLRQMTEIMSRGGGVGINISSLRPRHAYVKGVNGRSSGAVSWGALYSFVTGLIEQGGCFGPDERIATDQGLIPARELADRMDAGEVFYAQTHKGKRRITARFRNGIKSLYEMTTGRGYKVRITEDHKVAVLMDGKITTMPLKYLQPGDEVLLLLGQQTEGSYAALKPLHYQRSIMSTTLNEDVRLPEVLNEDLAYLLGYMHGDGYVHMGRKVNWRAPKAIKMATADAYPEIRTRIVDAVQRTFGMQPTIEDGDGACVTVAIHSRLVIEWMITNGLLKAKADAIRVPEAIFRSPASVQAAFIAGYFDADGCFRGKKGGYGIDSISREMLQDVQQILAANGIVSRISATDRSQQGWQTIYRLSVTGGTFKKRFAAFVPTVKASDVNGTRDMYITYPYSVWTSLGARAKYRQRIHDGVSERISFGQLERISERLLADGQTQTADRIAETLNTVTDTIASITPVGESEVFDFEVDEVHLLSGGGVYTSNSRRGALMLILDDWHPDVFDFINSKRTAGQITNANISVGISDKLMDAIKADGDWTLRFPDTGHAAYDAEWDGDIEKWEQAGYPVVTYRTVKAREVWNAIIESAWASAEPGVFFKERYNKMSNSWYFAPIISTNPCVTGDTLVATEYGYTKARDLRVGMKIRTPAGLKPIEKVYNNGIQRIYRVKFSDGGHLECTADHKLKVVRGKKYEWVAVSELRLGDKVLVSPSESFGSPRRVPEEVIRHAERRNLNVPEVYDRTLGFLTGVVVGDGTLRKLPSRNSYAYQCKVTFGAQETEWLDVFRSRVESMGIHTSLAVSKQEIALPNGVVALHQSVRLECYKLATLLAKLGMQPNVKAADKTIPEDFMTLDREFLAGVLDGLFSTDGNVSMKRDNPMLRFTTSSPKLAEQVRLVLLQFGIHGRIYAAAREKSLTYDGRSMHGTGVKYDVVIMNEGIVQFYSEIGLSNPYKARRLKEIAENWHYQGGSWTAAVTAVEDTGREEDVFDVYEPNTLTWITNGYVSFDCGEQGLPAFGVCNLGAINLAKFYDEERDDVKWDELDTAVRYATRFLDNVIDATPYFFEENKKQQLSERRVGLNNMGLAELLIRLRLRYGSPESLAFIDKLYAFIARAAYETSAELAAEKGAFPQFDAEKFLQSGFMKTMPEDIRELVRKKGIRNVTLLTQAPNGTTGTMVNTSTGIEPFFSWVYYRKSRLGLHEEKVPLVQEWLDAHPGVTELPDYFVTAMELAPEDHARVQGAIQRWCDSSISKTSNLPNSYTVEQTGKFYELLYELGCKGGTVYRDGSRDEQVLMLKGDERAESEMKKKEEAKAAGESSAVEQVATPHRVYPRPKKLTGVTVNVQTPYGTAYITMNSDENGYPFEVFITAPGKAGSDLQADAEGLGRLISLQLRSTAPQNRMQMLKLIIDQLQGIGGARSIGMGPNRVSSLPDAVAGALMEHYFPDDKMEQLALFNVAFPELNISQESAPALPSQTNGSSSEHLKGYKTGADVCPACGTVSLIRAEGCRKCTSCGYSEC